MLHHIYLYGQPGSEIVDVVERPIIRCSMVYWKRCILAMPKYATARFVSTDVLQQFLIRLIFPINFPCSVITLSRNDRVPDRATVTFQCSCILIVRGIKCWYICASSFNKAMTLTTSSPWCNRIKAYVSWSWGSLGWFCYMNKWSMEKIHTHVDFVWFYNGAICWCAWWLTIGYTPALHLSPGFTVPNLKHLCFCFLFVFCLFLFVCFDGRYNVKTTSFWRNYVKNDIVFT